MIFSSSILACHFMDRLVILCQACGEVISPELIFSSISLIDFMYLLLEMSDLFLVSLIFLTSYRTIFIFTRVLGVQRLNHKK